MLKKYLYIIIPVLAVALCSLLAFSSIDRKVADWFQRPLKPLEESKNVIMITVDDDTVSNIGSWPFSRNVYAQSITTLKELNAESVVFDLSFLDKSQAKFDEKYVTETLPEYVEDNFESINSTVSDFLDAFGAQILGAEDAEDAKNQILNTSENAKNSLSVSISRIVESQDENLANSLKFSGNSYLTLTFDDNVPELDKDNQNYLSQYISLEKINILKDSKTPEFVGVQPAISDFLVMANNAGFVNANPDKDGYLRRLHLIVKYNDKYYGQLVFVPILKHFGNPEIEVSDNQIVLKKCKFNDGSVKDIRIPRDKDGSVIVKYPKKDFVKYNIIPLWNIYRIGLLENEFYSYLEDMYQNGFFGVWQGDDPIEAHSNAEYLREALFQGEDPENGITSEQYLIYRNQFYSAVDAFLTKESMKALLAAGDFDDETVQYVKDQFASIRALFDNLVESRNEVKERVNNAICIIGTAATSTTDYGLNQYEEHYPNPGVHYTMANQLLSQDFVDDTPVIFSIIFAFVVCFFYCLTTRRIKSTSKQMLVGLSCEILAIVVLLLFFITTKKYIGVVIPAVSFLISFIGMTVSGFITTSRDKRFIQSAFSQCLSPDVVNEIMDNPDSFKLGGQTIDMTAIFTDIQKFSSFSELLSAGQLVALLNYYLTKMSDIIMEQRGTVDKYEGDAIVAFVGAPIKTSEHAALACRAAINMKKAEVLMNEEIKQVASGPKPEEMDNETYEAFCIMVKNNKKIFTRIGLNSGEIVAGYMGSTNKKNYTMMGNNVNLASRLEGVNKQYRTGGILMSAATRKGLDDRFVVRSLDRVQVVNVVTPIRLYELIGLKDEMSESAVQYVENWESAMKLFEAGEYAKALESFKKLSEENLEDNVAKYYIELIEKFFIKNTYPTEKDDFGVAYNPENPADMNEMWTGTAYEIKGTFKLLQK